MASPRASKFAQIAITDPWLPKKELEMTNSTVLIADMAILVGIFLVGLLAKLFPKTGRKASQKQ